MTALDLKPSVLDLVIGHVAGPLTRRPDRLGETTLGAVVADAIQAGAHTFCENVATLMDPDQLHADLAEEPRPHGDGTWQITVATGLGALPLSEMATTVILSGAQLHQALEEQFERGKSVLQPSQELSYAYSAQAPAGQKVDPASITIGGKAVDAATRYKISVSDTLRATRGGLPTLQAASPIPNGSAGGVGGAGNGTLFDLLAAYLSTRNPLPVPTGGRVVRSA